jgi:hypothetical protein
VTLAISCGGYDGAKPYFSVTRWSNRRQERFTPLETRANWLYEAFLRDITDPQALAKANA